MVRFSGFARKTNHFLPIFASEASKKDSTNCLQYIRVALKT
ncbi:MAG: hypothetical protein U5L45_12635 [Saprospiraceae bacterium]|nr:hypothetical protein [Saprospiraceae bacterium]